MTLLDDINKAIDEIGDAPPDPFNGATLIRASKDVADRLEEALLTYPVMGRPQIVVSDYLSEGHAVGFRPTKKGDSPKAITGIGLTLVFLIIPTP